MRLRILPVVLLFLAACSNYSDRVAARTEALPQIHLVSLKGQDLALDVTESRHHTKSLTTQFLKDDLGRALAKAGVNVSAKSPLQLHVTLDYIDSQYRTGRWESCAHMTGELVRDGSVVATPVAKFCENETPNPWQIASTQRAEANEAESRTRAYYGVLRTFLLNLDRSL